MFIKASDQVFTHETTGLVAFQAFHLEAQAFQASHLANQAFLASRLAFLASRLASLNT